MAALADTAAIAIATGRPESTIRYWAHRGWLTRHGTGPHNRALYDLTEATQLAQRLTLDNPPDMRQHSEHSQESAHQREAEPG